MADGRSFGSEGAVRVTSCPIVLALGSSRDPNPTPTRGLLSHMDPLRTGGRALPQPGPRECWCKQGVRRRRRVCLLTNPKF